MAERSVSLSRELTPEEDQLVTEFVGDHKLSGRLARMLNEAADRMERGETSPAYEEFKRFVRARRRGPRTAVVGLATRNASNRSISSTKKS